MRTRIVVADQSEARFYDTDRFDAPLQFAGRLHDPNARLHDRDFKSDRPGRVFDHAPSSGERRGAVAHHATGGERRPRQQEAKAFAHQIADSLQESRQADRFERIVLVAGPPFLGVLREALSASLRRLVAAEVHKDLVHQDDQVLRKHVSPELFKQSG